MLDKNWIAGFFDGEGSIYINWCNRKDNRSRYGLQISITNTADDVLSQVQLMYGGRVYHHSEGCSVWKICHRDLQIFFLKEMLPLLRIKKPQAEIALRYLSTVLDDKKHGYHPLPSETVSVREQCYQGLQAEHKKFTCKKVISDGRRQLLPSLIG